MSPMSTVVVGKECKATYLVHQAVLSKSPVVSAMCRQPFHEAETKRIELPEDDPVAIGRLLNYLYCSEYWVDKSLGIEEKVETWGDAYLLARKYQIDALQEYVMDEMTTNVKEDYTLLKGKEDYGDNSCKACTKAFFKLAQSLYKIVPPTDQHFRDWFVNAAWRYIWFVSLWGRDSEMVDAWGDFAQDGGHFAQDCVTVAKEYRQKIEPLDDELGILD